ncbi:MAG: hypothetical protein EXR79_13670 [Myxococcales bacterium]|nr:hypothetical protein [Myxococcales bacterium]
MSSPPGFARRDLLRWLLVLGASFAATACVDGVPAGESDTISTDGAADLGGSLGADDAADDDASAEVGPETGCVAGPETCDEIDNDCDGLTDEHLCDDGNPCTADHCAPLNQQGTGADLPNACTYSAAANPGGAPIPCDDGDACTGEAAAGGAGGDHCLDGTCVHGKAKACDDGSACTVGDHCAAGNCLSGKAIVCDDANPCTADSCDPQTGKCAHDGGPGGCDDGDACTTGDLCKAGKCAGAAVDCGDDNPCTEDACLADTGDCSHKNKPDDTVCSDGSLCTLADKCSHDGKCVGSAKLCDDGNPCTIDACKATTGACQFDNATGDPCDDGNSCTLGDACLAGVCAANQPKVCADGNPCTDDSCQKGNGACLFEPNQIGCDDGSACTLGDVCSAGKCKAGAAKVCEDGNICTSDGCDAKSGACSSPPIVDNVACEDGVPCTQGDACAGGKCQPGPTIGCDDGNPCTSDVCAPKTGKCAFSAQDGACDDGNGCTGGDACVSGTCASGKVVCECQVTADCAAQEDGNLCNGVLYCDEVSHACKVDLKSVVVCDESKNSACILWGCNPQAGKCEPKNGPDNVACEADSSVCTQGDHCVAGTCQPGPKTTCDDDNKCTVDLCDPKLGCTYGFATLACEDGNPCTYDDACDGGKCAAGPVKTCNDGNACTTDFCNPTTGKCAAAPIANSPCEDGNPCSLGDGCANGQCQPGAAKECKDGNVCTLDQCDPKGGTCAFPPFAGGMACDDGNACTGTDACQAGQCVSGPPTACNDANECTNDSCNVGSGKCVYAAIPNGSACNDDDACTIGDVCHSGKCAAGVPKPCASGLPCALAICDPATGKCLAMPDGLDCDDGNQCSEGDACKQGICEAATWLQCGDGNPCTSDACAPKTGKCLFSDASGPCDDGNCCTHEDHCKGGACVSVQLKDCNDGSPCTTDSCDPIDSCVYKPAPQGTACNDGSVCTTADHCNASGGCVGTGITCGDGNPCTYDSCNAKTGCAFTPHSNECNDGNPCTLKDKCMVGKCIPGAPLTCDDGIACTDDVCSQKDGGCYFDPSPDNVCSDGNLCALGDHCVGEACVSDGSAPNCDDKNACTADLCAPALGCQHLNNNAVACDDGNACTQPDACVDGKCKSGAPDLCDDGNTCTADVCDGVKGCGHKNLAEPCDDGNACAGPDTCIDGACTPKGAVLCNDSNVCTVDACDVKSGCTHLPEADGNAQKMTLVSDAQTGQSTEFVLVQGEPVYINPKPSVPTFVGPEWTAKIPGATWIWESALVKDPTLGLLVSFTREFDVQDGAGQVDGTLQLATDNDYWCWLNGKLISQSGFKADNYKVVTVVALKATLKVGKNLLRCNVHNIGMMNMTPQTNPAGLLYRLDLSFAKPGKTCDDGNVCTQVDVCWGGTCSGLAAAKCDDGNPCTLDICNVGAGCSSKPAAGAPCDDGNPCTAKDLCLGTTCGSASKVLCDDGNACTKDGCQDSLGCVHQVASTGESIAVIVTSDKQTLANGKAAVAAWDGYAGWTHGIADATWIWSSETVAEPTKETKVTFAREFSIPPGWQTLVGTLQMASDGAFVCTVNGYLVSVKVEEANFAKAIALPISGKLKTGVNALVCTVTNPGKAGSTAQTNPAGLLYRMDIAVFGPGGATPCSDGNACTDGDWCKIAKCQSGPAVSCDDDNGCTADSCDSQKGCGHTPNDAMVCDDGDKCTVVDACTAGVCKGTQPANCDDFNPCTNEACDAKTGCGHVPNSATCDDGDVCTAKDVCQAGKCVPAAGAACDDGNPCTVDGCAAVTGCFHNVANGGACDDGNVCTVDDLCSGGTCLGKDQNPCNDGDACTADACEPAKGCLNAALDSGKCEDGNPCTVNDACKAGKCTSGSQKACFDTEACTLDSCDIATGKCVFVPVAAGKCEDGNLCSTGDLCEKGKCLPGKPRECGDGNPCTMDACDPATGGCFHPLVENGLQCDDGQPCTTPDACQDGTCAGKAKVCDDGKPCTIDSCELASGKCVSKPGNCP